MRHRRDAWQRLAAEAEGGDRAEIVRTADLARRVPFDREPRILRRHPFPIVLDANGLLASELDADVETARAGIDRVLDELLDDRGRPFHDLAGRDLVGKVGGQYLDASHAYSQPLNLKTASIAAAIPAMALATHQNCTLSPPGKCGSGTFIPHMPV